MTGTMFLSDCLRSAIRESRMTRNPSIQEIGNGMILQIYRREFSRIRNESLTIGQQALYIRIEKLQIRNTEKILYENRNYTSIEYAGTRVEYVSFRHYRAQGGPRGEDFFDERRIGIGHHSRQ